MFRKRKLRGTAHQAHLDLGRWFFKEDLGDEGIRKKVAEVEDRIESIRVAKGKTKHLEQERDGLLIRLGETGEAHSDSPDVAARIADVKQSDSDVENEGAGIRKGLRELAPGSPAGWLRLAAGYGVIILCLFLTASHLIGGSRAR